MGGVGNFGKFPFLSCAERQICISPGSHTCHKHEETAFFMTDIGTWSFLHLFTIAMTLFLEVCLENRANLCCYFGLEFAILLESYGSNW